MSREIFYFVTVEETQENKEYWELVKPALKTQAAIWLQHAWLKKKGHTQRELTFNSANFFKYKWRLAKPDRIGPIVEEKSNKYIEHATRIKKNKWLELDFSDPYFESNIYKALRLSQINCYDAFTALKIYWARYEFREVEIKGFHGKISQYDFLDEKGPYDLKSIPYANPENIKLFKEKLTLLPENQRCYFAAEFSLFKQLDYIYAKLINQYNHQNTDKATLISEINLLIPDIINKISTDNRLEILNKTKFNEEDLTDLKKFLNDYLSKYYYEKDVYIKDRHSANTLKIGTGLEKMPGVIISEGKLFFIFLADKAFLALSEAVHGEDATQLSYVLGGFDLHYMYEKAFQNKRPVEGMLSNISPASEVHKMHPQKFAHHWHDYFHLWRNSSNMFRLFVLYAIKLLNREKGFKLSQPIFELLDLDSASGKILRILANSLHSGIKIDSTHISESYHYAIWDTLINATDQYYMKHLSPIYKLNITEHYLILLFDMVENDKSWRDFFNVECIKIITDNIPELKEEKPFYEYLFKHVSKMKIVLETIKGIITATPGKSTLYRIILFKMEKYAIYLDSINSALQSLHLEIEDVLKWRRNKGIYIVKGNVDIMLMSPEKLTTHLFNIYFNIVNPIVESIVDVDEALAELVKKNAAVDVATTEVNKAKTYGKDTNQADDKLDKAEAELAKAKNTVNDTITTISEKLAKTDVDKAAAYQNIWAKKNEFLALDDSEETKTSQPARKVEMDHVRIFSSARSSKTPSTIAKNFTNTLCIIL